MIAGVDAPIISRTEDHRYYYQGAEYPSVTTILKVLDKSDTLVPWAAKQTAEAAIKLHMDGTLTSMISELGVEGARKGLSDRSNWTRDTAAAIGTRIHDMADALVQGRELTDTAPDITKRVEHYAEWWKASGWRLRLSEAYVVHPAMKYAGTFDLLCYDEDGKTTLADIKTGGKYGRKAYDSEVLQIAAYGMAPLVARGTDTRTFPMPSIERYVLLHVTDRGVRPIDVKVGGAEELAFLACCDLAAWRQTTKGRRL